MKTRLLPLTAFCSLFLSMYSFGSIVTYDVNLSATDAISNHTLSLVGTITVDADLAFDVGFQTSDLQVLHESDPPVSLDFMPTFTGDTNANLRWVVDGLSLFVERIGTGDSAMSFASVGGFQTGSFQLGSGAFGHQVGFSDFFAGDIDTGVLRAADGTDVGSGMFIGVVPEPSSFLMMALGMGCLAGRRKKNLNKKSA